MKGYGFMKVDGYEEDFYLPFERMALGSFAARRRRRDVHWRNWPDRPPESPRSEARMSASRVPLVTEKNGIFIVQIAEGAWLRWWDAGKRMVVRIEMSDNLNSPLRGSATPPSPWLY